MKKFIALFVNMFAKKRKGADLIIQKTDGNHVRGGLIAVKQNSLLLLERESGADVTVDVGDIRFVKIVKKSNAEKGTIYGLTAGGGFGLIAGILSIGEEDGFFDTFIDSIIFIGLPLTLIGALIGALIDLVSKIADKTIQFDGKSDSEIQEILEKLRKKARIRNSQ